MNRDITNDNLPCSEPVNQWWISQVGAVFSSIAPQQFVRESHYFTTGFADCADHLSISKMTQEIVE
jgi:hypothetical protein